MTHPANWQDVTQRKAHRQQRRAVLTHYGRACAWCEHPDHLELDHTANDGATHRQQLRADDQSLEEWLVAHLLFQQGSLTYVREALRRMAERQLLAWFPLPMPSGARLRVYALGAKGRVALSQGGYYTPSKLRSLSYGYLWHSLLLTRFCVAATAWCRQTPSFTLVETRLSYELSRTLPRITLVSDEHETQVTVFPSAGKLGLGQA